MTIPKSQNDSFDNGIRESAFVINTHRSSPTHADEIKQFLIKKKCQQLWFIGHEFAQLPSRRSFIEMYEKGELKYRLTGPDFKWLPEWAIYLKDILTTIKWLLFYVRIPHIYLGISAFDTLPAILCRPVIKFKRIIFLTIDFVPKRFSNTLLNNLYIYVDHYCLSQADETWNPSPRMAEGREKIWGYDTKLRKNQRSFSFGIWVGDPPNFKLKSPDPEMIFSGHLIPKQGVQLAINSLPEILKSVPKAKLSIIGTGEYLSDLKNLVQKLQLATHVNFYGFVDSETQNMLLKKAWLGLATFDPKLDTFSYYADPGKIKIYLGSGLPVILTDVPYIAKTIKATKAGIIVNYDEHEFAKAAVKLLGNQNLLKEYSHNSINLAKRYDWNIILTSALKPLFS
jgi:glycosyltransferase involved in cell wall biosynthesis